MSAHPRILEHAAGAADVAPPLRDLDAFVAYLASAHGYDRVVALDCAGCSATGGIIDVAALRSGRRSLTEDVPHPGNFDAGSIELAQALVVCRSDPRDARENRILWSTLERSRVSLLLLKGQELDGRPPDALSRLLERGSLRPMFVGLVSPTPARAYVGVYDSSAERFRETPPGTFNALAIIPTYNEEDIIVQTLRDVIAQGLEAYLLDNWSTDATVVRARPFLGRGLRAIERFPQRAPATTYDLTALMARVEEIAAEQRWADWIVLHDADERRRSPWREVRLREALWRVERSGFNCVDHVTLNFWPVDDAFDPSTEDLEAHFQYFEFSSHAGHFHQRRAWKRTDDRVALTSSAGHDVAFPGRRVYPYKFLLKHYPIRSRAHGERKVLKERLARFSPAERALGWHRQYDAVQTEGFIRDPSALRRFDPSTFDDECLIERLSGVRVFTTPPSWATPPCW